MMKKTHQQGYIALVTVIIVSAVALAIASTVSLLAIGSAQTSFAVYKGEDSLQLAEGCAEDGLLKAQQSSSYSGGNITRPEGTCVITVMKSGANWTLTATSTQTTYNRTVQVKFTRLVGNVLAISSWQDSGSIPTPTPTATPTPTNTPTPAPPATPTPTPKPILAQDTFQRANQSHWGTASDGHAWGLDASSKSMFTITNNTGQVVGDNTGNTYTGTLGSSITNAGVLVKGYMQNTYQDSNWGPMLRYQDSTHYYKAFIGSTNNSAFTNGNVNCYHTTGTYFVLLRNNGGTNFIIDCVVYNANPDTNYSLRFETVGTAIRAKFWPTGGAEPSTWTISGTDTTFSSGLAGIRTVDNNNAITNITSFVLYSS